MEGIYEVSSSDRVKSLDRELERELKDLQNEIEEGNFLSEKDPPESFSSFHVPMDIDYFINQRKYAIKNCLQVREAKPLQSQADLMEDEMKSCLKNEYNQNSIPLLLHQFYLKRVKELILLKHLHMLRWARFCQHTKVIEGLYPEYSKRMNEIILEYQDALERARRLSCTHEAYLRNSSMPISVVKNEDLLIYTRWLVCHFHAVKKIHAFLQVIQWIPQSYTQMELIYEEIKYKGDDTDQTKSSVNVQQNHTYVPLRTTSSNFISSDCRFHEPKIAKTFAPIHTIAVWKRKAARARERGMMRKYRPVLSCNVKDFEGLLDFLLSTYEIGMCTSQLESVSDEMDMFNLVLHKFKEVHFRQEQNRIYPVYGMIEENGNSQERDGIPVVYKRESNWLPFIQIKPDVDGLQLASLTKLKQQNHVDELLVTQSKLFYVDSSEKILFLMKEHVKQTEDQTKIQPTNVTTFQKGNPTQDIWKKLFTISNGYSSKNDVLEFDSKIQNNNIGVNEGRDVHDAASTLGLEVDDADTHPISSNGAVLSLMLLRHLKIKDFRHTCLCMLNYFRSIERSLTIDDIGLSIKDDDVMTPPPQHLSHDSDLKAIGSHQYLHNTPVDYAIQANEHIQCTEVENHDNFYIFKEDNIYVQDEHGQYIIYDCAFKDFSKLEEELHLVGSNFVKKGSEKLTSGTMRAFTNDFDLNVYGSRMVDRFGVLMDLWGNEASYLECKRRLLDCFLETYHHVVCVEERKKLAQIIITIIYKRPRLDFSDEYFVTSYQSEVKLLTLYFELIKSIIDEQIDDQRAYVQKLHRDEKKQYGVPFKIVPIQCIAVNNSHPALKNIFMLEFHPSLAMISSVPVALSNAFQELLHVHPPKTTNEQIKLEIYLFEVTQEKWVKKKAFGETYADKVKKELLSEVFVEDPMFVSEIGESLNPLKIIGGRTVTKEEVQKMIELWAKLLEVVTFRNRLLHAMNESDILVDIYQKNATNLGYDSCHAFLRPSSFERAQSMEEVSIKPLATNKLLSDENKVDRYSPSQSYLAISDLDEKHMTLFTFKNRKGLINNMQNDALEKLRLTLLVQICHKNLFVSLLHQINGCRNIIRSTSIKNVLLVALNKASKNAMISQLSNKLKNAFVSVQGEKMYYRDCMLNDFKKVMEKKGLQKLDDITKVKRDVIRTYCLKLHKGLSLHALRAQIIAYNHSMHELFNSFPVTRDSHFILGEENEIKKNVPDELTPHPAMLKRRPRRFLSSDGEKLLNLWFIPHFTEILTMYQKLDGDKCTAILKVILQLTAALHDICQYLCAHARSGSSHARRGTQKMEFSSDTADWGGAEGIGSELRDIQRQINQLEDPTDPEKVAQFLVFKRDVMFLEYDITINHSVPNSFLASGNKKAYKCITACSDLQKLGNLSRRSFTSFNLDLPEPLSPTDTKAKELFPWRSFVSRYGYITGCYNQFYDIAFNMQLPLMGLRDIDKRIVHGEILGVSLLLEDVLAAGIPYISPVEDKSSKPGSRKVSASIPKEKANEKRLSESAASVATTVQEQQMRNRSIYKSPVEAMKFLRTFLITWSQLEHMKQTWGCRRLYVARINSTKLYKSFLHLFNTEVMQQVYKRFASREDSTAFEMQNSGEANEEQVFDLPPNVTEYELKIHLLCRLLENIEIMMIQDCIRRISRENTQVVAERAREDHMLPTDLWKNATMKENVTIQRSYIIQKFIDDLKIPGDSEVLTFNRNHFDDCLMKLANACTIREKTSYLSYATFYENLLRQHNQVLYMREQEIKQLNGIIASNKTETSVEIDCGLADKSFGLLIEVTALRAKVRDLSNVIEQREKSIGKNLREIYNDLILDLFNNAFGMVTRFEKFQLSLYDDVIQQLTDVRRSAVEKIKNVHLKHGTKTDIDSDSTRLIFSEKLREVQRENKDYVAMLTKLKTVNHWNCVKNKSNFQKRLRKAEKNLEKAKNDNFQKSIIHEEKENLMKEEKDELRKLLVSLERECESLRKQLDKEQKLQAQRAHTQLQEQQSLRHLRTAKASNWEKLVSDLFKKEQELQSLKDTNVHDRRHSARSASEMKRLLKLTTQQVQDERKLKLDAYGRVDELQKQVSDLEMQITNLLAKEKSSSYHETCFPLVHGGLASPHRPKPRSQQGMIPVDNRPKSSIPHRPKSGLRVSSKPVTPVLKANKSDMFISGSNWVPYGM